MTPEGGGNRNRGAVAPGGSGSLFVDESKLVLPTRKARRQCQEIGHRLEVLDGWSEFLSSLLPAVSEFVTLTRRDSTRLTRNRLPVVRWGTPKAAFRDVHRLYRDCSVKGPTFWVTEPTPDRGELHLHGLCRELNPGENERIFRTALHRFGRVSIRRANPGALPYVCKYLFKSQCCGRYDWVDLSGLHRDAAE